MHSTLAVRKQTKRKVQQPTQHVHCDYHDYNIILTWGWAEADVLVIGSPRSERSNGLLWGGGGLVEEVERGGRMLHGLKVSVCIHVHV